MRIAALRVLAAIISGSSDALLDRSSSSEFSTEGDVVIAGGSSSAAVIVRCTGLPGLLIAVVISSISNALEDSLLIGDNAAVRRE